MKTDRRQRALAVLDGPIVTRAVISLIIFSTICYSIETVPTISATTRLLLGYAEYFVIGLFTVEYVARVALSPRPLRFIVSFYGVIDLLAILPFYLALAIDLRSLRLLRIFRLVRLFKLARYTRALIEVREELIIYTGASLVCIYLSAVGIYHLDHQAQPQVYTSIFDCIWWSVATLTTVGYGDVYPITLGGKLFTMIILFVGLGMVAVPTGMLAAALANVRRRRIEKIVNSPGWRLMQLHEIAGRFSASQTRRKGNKCLDRA